MIGYLKKFFNPDNPSLDASLAISMGLQGARLSHSHERYGHRPNSLEMLEGLSGGCSIVS